MTHSKLLSLIGALASVPMLALAADQPLPSEIGARDLGGGRLFVTADGLTLYTYKRDSEQPGTSTCVDECASTWPPVIASEDAKPQGDWELIARPDGSLQWAYRGEPVYRYVKDTVPGTMVGEKASGSWDVLYEAIETPPNVMIKPTVLGQTLAILNGHTIYTGPESECEGVCLTQWKPVEAPWLAGPVSDDWTISQSADGLPQWTYKQKPLFTYAGDFNADDCNGLDADGGWTVMVLQDAPGIPEWVTFQETDIGPVMATSDHMTLYYLLGDWETIRLTTCDEACVAENWDPIIAPEKNSSIGNWATAPTEDGRWQWTYLGQPVSTFKGDRMPGDTYGDKFGTGSDIRGGWVAILQETLIQNLAR